MGEARRIAAGTICFRVAPSKLRPSWQRIYPGLAVEQTQVIAISCGNILCIEIGAASEHWCATAPSTGSSMSIPEKCWASCHQNQRIVIGLENWSRPASAHD
jgi:hypothetical protein